MDSATDNLDKTLKLARSRYERARAGQAVLGFLPVFLLVGAVCAVGGRPWWALGFGTVLFVVGAVALWYGRDVRRAVLPGVAGGLVPLVLVLGAAHLGHACHGAGCTSLCLAACLVGGSLAGFLVGRSLVARTLGVPFWVAASLVAILTGAMGCARLGFAGIAALVVSYAIGSVPGLLWRRFKRAT